MRRMPKRLQKETRQERPSHARCGSINLAGCREDERYVNKGIEMNGNSLGVDSRASGRFDLYKSIRTVPTSTIIFRSPTPSQSWSNVATISLDAAYATTGVISSLKSRISHLSS